MQKKEVAKFEKRISTEVRRQKKIDMVEEGDFMKEGLQDKYIAKMLYRWDNKKVKGEVFKEAKEKLAKMEVCFSRGEILKEEGDNVRLKDSGLDLFLFSLLFLFYFIF